MKRLLSWFEESSHALRLVGISVRVAGAYSASAAFAKQSSAGRAVSPSIFMEDMSGTFVAVGADALTTQAQEMNEVRMIVEFDANHVPGAERIAPVAVRQSTGISTAQQRMVGKLADPKNVRSKKIPYMAMTVSPSDLSRLVNRPVA